MWKTPVESSSTLHAAGAFSCRFRLKPRRIGVAGTEVRLNRRVSSPTWIRKRILIAVAGKTVRLGGDATDALTILPWGRTRNIRATRLCNFRQDGHRNEPKINGRAERVPDGSDPPRPRGRGVPGEAPVRKKKQSRFLGLETQ